MREWGRSLFPMTGGIMRPTRLQAILLSAFLLGLGMVTTASASDGDPVLAGKTAAADSPTVLQGGGFDVFGETVAITARAADTYDGFTPDTGITGIEAFGNDTGGYIRGVDVGLIAIGD